MSETLRHYINDFGAGREVSADDAMAFFDAILVCKDEPLLTKLLLAWNTKGITENEIVELATIMRSRMHRVDPRGRDVVDIVGTGGSKAKSFNVSTAAAFVIAGAGVPVAKHGNKAATSNSGSADVLDHLGVRSNASPEIAQQCLDEIGICFMFAPRFHSLSPTLAGVRRGLGVPTIFNCLGPLCNPASAPHQLIGVWDEELVPVMANALSRLGTKRSWIVHGGGLDEISLNGKTRVSEIRGHTVKSCEINEAHFDPNETSGEIPHNLSPNESSSWVREIVENKRVEEPAERLVLLNAAAAIFVSGHSPNLPEAMSIARESIRTGAALNKLNCLAEATNQ